MSCHRYPFRALAADHLRGLAGLGLVVGILLVPMHPLLAGVLGVVAAVLIAFGVRTLAHQLSRVEISDQRIELHGPWARGLDWIDLEGLSLRYYAVRRDRRHGWMALILVGADGRILIESQIEGFEAIVERATKAATARGLALDDSTRINLAALDIAAPPTAASAIWGI